MPNTGRTLHNIMEDFTPYNVKFDTQQRKAPHMYFEISHKERKNAENM